MSRAKFYIINLLKLRKGDVKFKSDLGLSPDYIDTPLNLIKGQIMSDILENITTYYPQCNVESIDVETQQTTGDTIFKAVIKI